MTDPNTIQEPPPAQTPQTVDINRYEEERRKREAAEQEIAILRDQQLRLMAQRPAAVQPTPEPEVEDESLQYLDPQQRRAFEVLLDKREAKIRKESEKMSADVYQRESAKTEAVNMFPDLQNPQSEFFKRVAIYMDSNPSKYKDPHGLREACKIIAYDMKYQAAPTQRQTNQQVVRSVSGGAASVEGSSGTPQTEADTLDAKAIMLAKKLGIDEKEMTQRMKDLQTGSGAYAPTEGKTGKMSII